MPRGHSRLRFSIRDGRTALIESCTELPLLVQRPLRGPAGQAILTLLTPAAALFDGDVVDLDVACEPCADVTLVTTSATKLNRCDTSSVHFALTVHVAEDATFRYLPHELIPFAGARYDQRITVELESGARTWLMEVIAPGASDAPFGYAQLDFATNIFTEGVLQVRERFHLTPRTARQLGGHSHYGSLLTVPNTLRPREDMAVSTLPGGGSVLKLLGSSAQRVRSRLLDALPDRDWLSRVAM